MADAPAGAYLVDDVLAELIEVKERIQMIELKLRKLKR